MAILTDFMAAINQIASERGINADKIYDALKESIIVAYKKEFYVEGKSAEGREENLSVEMNPENGQFRLIAKKLVVERVVDPNYELSLKQARKVSKNLKIGDIVEVELPTDDLGRIAAQTAKQVVLQKIREFEKNSIIAEYSGKVGQVFNALMQRMYRGNVIFEIGKATAVMPIEEQIPNEFYKVGERYKVLLKDIADTPRGKELVVSRADSNLLIELFKVEVPEIESGVVEIKSVAREAGSRSKISVISHQEGVDPIGSCVGQRGIRIANVMGEIGEEKIDIIEWEKDLTKYVANALSPAKVEKVTIKFDTAIVKVVDDQLSLAIGKDGQNVRLASKLVGIKIEIVGDNKKTKDELGSEVAQELKDEVVE